MDCMIKQYQYVWIVPQKRVVFSRPFASPDRYKARRAPFVAALSRPSRRRLRAMRASVSANTCARPNLAERTRGSRRGRGFLTSARAKSSSVAAVVVKARTANASRWVSPHATWTASRTARSRTRAVRASAVLTGEGDQEERDRNAGRLLLVSVAAMYGTLSVCLKMVFETAGAPTAGVLGGIRGLMTVLCFTPMLLAKGSKGGPEYTQGAGFWRAACELALWNLGNQGLCNVALLFTDATRVSFFTQASIAFTPFIASIGGDKVRRMTWLGCVLAFVGVAVLGMDGGASTELAGFASSFNFGDLLSIAGAASYSMYVYRIGHFAKAGFYGQGLQVWKNAFLAAMYGGWALYDIFAFSSGVPGAAVPFAAWGNLKIWALLAFSAVIPGCLADLTQSKGQETVSASESSVLLAGEPLFAALFGAITLGEFLGPMGYAGGSLIVLGGLVASGVFGSKKVEA